MEIPFEIIINVQLHASPFVRTILRRVCKALDNRLGKDAEKVMASIDPSTKDPLKLYLAGMFDVAEYLGIDDEKILSAYYAYMEGKYVDHNQVDHALVFAANSNDATFVSNNLSRVGAPVVRKALDIALNNNYLNTLSVIVRNVNRELFPKVTREYTKASKEAVIMVWKYSNPYEILKSMMGEGIPSGKSGFIDGAVNADKIEVLSMVRPPPIIKNRMIRTKKLFNYLTRYRIDLHTLSRCDELEEFDIDADRLAEAGIQRILVEKISFERNYKFVKRFIRYSTDLYELASCVRAEDKHIAKLLEVRIREFEKIGALTVPNYL
jgi:hypothetical protein